MALYLHAQDHSEPYDAPEPEGCHCEQALQATVDRLSRENHSLRDELSGHKQGDREGWTLAQDVLQAETLEAAKAKASTYLGLTTPF